jgi:hypothetical protein
VKGNEGKGGPAGLTDHAAFTLHAFTFHFFIG